MFIRLSFAAIAIAAFAPGLPVLAADSVEVLENYSPVRASRGGGQFYYASPSYAAYRDNVMAGLVAGLDAFGPEGSPTRFEAFDRNVFTVFETTGTPFNSWLGDVTPEGAYANEFGTHVRAALRVESDDAFTINDVFYRYSDDIGNDFSATFGQLGFRFGISFIGRRPDGTLVSDAGADPFQPIVGLYFLGFANIVVNGRQTPEEFIASGQTPEAFFRQINLLYAGDPYSFRDYYTLRRGGVDGAFDALEGDIVAGIPEPATWSLLIAGFGLVGAGLRRKRDVLSLI